MTAAREGTRTLRLATRGSPLALVQARIVAGLLGREVEVELVVIETSGDRRQSVPLHAIGGQGVFVKEVEAAVLEGRAEAAVHSAKDLPASPGGPLVITAVPERADPRDALVGLPLAQLRPGAQVATGAVRRRAQLAWALPGLVFTELRGNMGTRLSKVPAGGAVVVAMAALDRLGWADRACEVLSTTVMLPQAGQGAIAVSSRPGDEETASVLARADHRESHLELEAERAFLAAIGGGCELPVGAHAECLADGSLALEAMIASLDGHVLVRERVTGREHAALGPELAARLLDGSGGRGLLARLGPGDNAPGPRR